MRNEPSFWTRRQIGVAALALWVGCSGGDGGVPSRPDGGDGPAVTTADGGGADTRALDSVGAGLDVASATAGPDASGDTPGGSGADARVEDGPGRDGSPASGPRMLDLLFVIDDSYSMAEEQANLVRNFPTLVAELGKSPGGLPDLRIGIVSTDVGAGSFPVSTCQPQGKRGRFQVRPGCGLDPAVSHWLSYGQQGAAQNFQGDLASVFACLATLGTIGCGFEHTLQALRLALAGRTINPENEGFLRPDAHLGIVILSDEDDCSAPPDAEIFNDFTESVAPSLRCALLGHTCGGARPTLPAFSAPLSTCGPVAGEAVAERPRQRLIDVSEFVDFVKLLKPGRPDSIMVGAIIGWNSDPGATYRIGERESPAGKQVDLLPICQSAQGSATPALRIKAFVDAFGPRGVVLPICAADYRPVMARLGELLVGGMR